MIYLAKEDLEPGEYIELSPCEVQEQRNETAHCKQTGKFLILRFSNPPFVWKPERYCRDGNAHIFYFYKQSIYQRER